MAYIYIYLLMSSGLNEMREKFKLIWLIKEEILGLDLSEHYLLGALPQLKTLAMERPFWRYDIEFMLAVCNTPGK